MLFRKTPTSERGNYVYRFTINVTDLHGKTGTVLKGADARLPARLDRFLFGDFTQVYLLKLDQSVESVDVKEVKEGGSGNGKDERACDRTCRA